MSENNGSYTACQEESKKPARSGNGRFIVMRDITDHSELGKLSLAELGAYYIILTQADFETGVWVGSAPKLRAAAPKDLSLRDTQRILERLRKIGFIKPFRDSSNQRGNYPVLINKYEPLVGPHRGERLNAHETTDPKTPVWEPKPCARAASERVHKLAPENLSATPENSESCEEPKDGVCAQTCARAASEPAPLQYPVPKTKINHDRRDRDFRPKPNCLYLKGKAWEELEVENLPSGYKPFVDLVEDNPRDDGEHLVHWMRRIRNLCHEEGIEYPKVFHMRLKQAERDLDLQDDPFGEMSRVMTSEQAEAGLRAKYGHLMK